jgi:hypothetical protein
VEYSERETMNRIMKDHKVNRGCQSGSLLLPAMPDKPTP